MDTTIQLSEAHPWAFYAKQMAFPLWRGAVAVSPISQIGGIIESLKYAPAKWLEDTNFPTDCIASFYMGICVRKSFAGGELSLAGYLRLLSSLRYESLVDENTISPLRFRYVHFQSDSSCQCLWSRVVGGYPYECSNCFRLLPNTFPAPESFPVIFQLVNETSDRTPETLAIERMIARLFVVYPVVEYNGEGSMFRRF